MTKAGTGNMLRHAAILLLMLLCNTLAAQEVLLPLRHPAHSASKDNAPVELPFFDDFSSPTLSRNLWDLGGAFINQGYAPLPPTIGMVTLDAFDPEGFLYTYTSGQLFTGDTLSSRPIRMDSVFHPYSRQTPSSSNSIIPHNSTGSAFGPHRAALRTPSLPTQAPIGNSKKYPSATPSTSVAVSSSVSTTSAAWRATTS